MPYVLKRILHLKQMEKCVRKTNEHSQISPLRPIKKWENIIWHKDFSILKHVLGVPDYIGLDHPQSVFQYQRSWNGKIFARRILKASFGGHRLHWIRTPSISIPISKFPWWEDICKTDFKSMFWGSQITLDWNTFNQSSNIKVAMMGRYLQDGF